MDPVCVSYNLTSTQYVHRGSLCLRAGLAVVLWFGAVVVLYCPALGHGSWKRVALELRVAISLGSGKTRILGNLLKPDQDSGGTLAKDGLASSCWLSFPVWAC